MNSGKKIPNSDVIEELDFLARSSNRVQVLEHLAQANQLEKDRLREKIDGTRTTLSRNLDGLEDRGWIRTSNHRCTITPAGEQVVEDFLVLEETVEVAIRLQEFFEWLSADEFDLDLSALADAELYTPNSGDPYAMINRHVEVIKNSSHQRVLLPYTGLHPAKATREQVVEGGTTSEIIAESAVLEAFQTDPQFADVIDDMTGTDKVDILEYSGSFPYALAILDGTVQLFAGEENEPRAMVETESSEVYEWANQNFEMYRDQATRIF